MHPPSRQVAQTPELLDAIVGHLQLDRTALANLSQASNNFHDVTIRHLWAGTDNPIPEEELFRPDTLQRLVALLPDDILGPQPWGSLSERNFEDSDWLRFRHYSVHTRTMALNTDQYSPRFLLQLGRRRETLFPRLVSLVINESEQTEHLLAEWMLLAGPSLRRLEINGPVWAPPGNTDYRAVFCSASEQLARITPHLIHLDITIPTSIMSKNQTEMFCSAISSLAKLETLQLQSSETIPEETLSNLTHPTASTLILDSPSNCSATSSTMKFPSLRNLSLTGHAEAMRTCMETIGPTHFLSTLSIIFVHSGDPYPSFQPFSPSISNATKLSRFTLSLMDSASWAGLRPLLVCGSVTYLWIHSESSISGLDDAALEDLAASFPRLETLYIVDADTHSEDKITLHGLIPLASSCPRLRELTLRITTRVISKANALPVKREFNRSFYFLRLVRSEINPEGDTSSFLGPHGAARFLKSLWPSLKPSGVCLEIESSMVEPRVDREVENSLNKEKWQDMLRFMEDLEKL